LSEPVLAKAQLVDISFHILELIEAQLGGIS
jgi:hypothetical protein